MNMRSKDLKSKISAIKGYIIGVVACVPFLLFGLAFIAFGSNEIIEILPCTAEVEGRVNHVSMVSEKKWSNRRGYHTVYSYTAHYSYELNNETITDVLYTGLKIEKGQIITIKYDPNHPDNKYVKKYSGTSGFSLISVFGIVWSALFVFIIYAIIINAKYALTKIEEDEKNRTEPRLPPKKNKRSARKRVARKRSARRG